MGQFSMVIYTPPGSHLSGNQQTRTSANLYKIFLGAYLGAYYASLKYKSFLYSKLDMNFESRKRTTLPSQIVSNAHARESS
jgi:hypothetical protein